MSRWVPCRSNQQRFPVLHPNSRRWMSKAAIKGKRSGFTPASEPATLTGKLKMSGMQLTPAPCATSTWPQSLAPHVANQSYPHGAPNSIKLPGPHPLPKPQVEHRDRRNEGAMMLIVLPHSPQVPTPRNLYPPLPRQMESPATEPAPSSCGPPAIGRRSGHHQLGRIERSRPPSPRLGLAFRSEFLTPASRIPVLGDTPGLAHGASSNECFLWCCS